MSSQTKPHYHFIGIGGIGMSGLALALLKKGYTVSGSDLSSNEIIQNLIKAGATIYQGHSGAWIKPSDTIVYNSSIKDDNPEIETAKKFCCPIYHRSDILAGLMKNTKTLSIAGTHGKTTTSSLLTAILKSSGYDPSYFIGGILAETGQNSDLGDGLYLIAEADESDGTFLKYSSYGSITTNIGLDHMSYFRSEENLVRHFEQFLTQTQSKDLCFWCKDDQRLANINPAGQSYGFNKGCDLTILNFEQRGWHSSLDLSFKDRHFPKVEISLLGRHNALNAAAVFGLSYQLGVPEEKIRTALKSFKGVGRRAENKGIYKEVLMLDDYAHHPTEIKTTLAGIREAIQTKRMIVVFQPHRYSRIKDCLGSFQHVFDQADKLIVTEIYSAGEHAVDGITHASILQEIPHINSEHIRRDCLTRYLKDFLKPNDVLVTLGAGDITYLSAELKNDWK